MGYAEYMAKQGMHLTRKQLRKTSTTIREDEAQKMEEAEEAAAAKKPRRPLAAKKRSGTSSRAAREFRLKKDVRDFAEGKASPTKRESEADRTTRIARRPRGDHVIPRRASGGGPPSFATFTSTAAGPRS